MLRPEELFVFKAFFAADPEFAGTPIVSWGPGGDPPDVICCATSGARIGVELAEWLDESQIETSVERARLEATYLKAVRSE